MSMKLPFVKMHGAGNDYIYMDSIENPAFNSIPDYLYPDLARKISNRHTGIGSDGLILILPSEKADFLMRIFNADGSEAQMCGNGIRCVAKYVIDRGLSSVSTLKIDTLAGVKTINYHKDEKDEVAEVTVDMGEPILQPQLIPTTIGKNGPLLSEEIRIDGEIYNITAVGMGNPHCVVFVNEITDDHVFRVGPLIENHPLFPEKTNVEFIKVVDFHKLRMRVWERGSGETMACGTGTCAATVAAFLNGKSGREVDVLVNGGTIHVNYDKNSNHLFMTGPAEFVAEGIYFYHE